MTPPPLFHLTRGRAPIIVSFPHSGTYLPPEIAARMTDIARTVPDTDWHVPRLYTFLEAMGASRIEATHSRYVTDLNRPPDDQELYAGQKKTGLVPVDTFLYLFFQNNASEKSIGLSHYFYFVF
jgi:N-formylglutamate deformylase